MVTTATSAPTTSGVPCWVGIDPKAASHCAEWPSAVALSPPTLESSAPDSQSATSTRYWVRIGPALPTTAATGTSTPSAAASPSQLPLAPAWMIASSRVATATTIANARSSRYWPVHQAAPRSGLVAPASMSPICWRNHRAPSVNQAVTPCMSELLADCATEAASRPGVGRQPSSPAGPPGQEAALGDAALAAVVHSLAVTITVAASNSGPVVRRGPSADRDIRERLESVGCGDELGGRTRLDLTNDRHRARCGLRSLQLPVVVRAPSSRWPTAPAAAGWRRSPPPPPPTVSPAPSRARDSCRAGSR